VELPLGHVAQRGEPVGEGLALPVWYRLGDVGPQARVDLLEEPELVQRGHVVLGGGLVDPSQVLLRDRRGDVLGGQRAKCVGRGSPVLAERDRASAQQRAPLADELLARDRVVVQHAQARVLVPSHLVAGGRHDVVEREPEARAWPDAGLSEDMPVEVGRVGRRIQRTQRVQQVEVGVVEEPLVERRPLGRVEPAHALQRCQPHRVDLGRQ